MIAVTHRADAWLLGVRRAAVGWIISNGVLRDAAFRISVDQRITVAGIVRRPLPGALWTGLRKARAAFGDRVTRGFMVRHDELLDGSPFETEAVHGDLDCAVIDNRKRAP